MDIETEFFCYSILTTLFSLVFFSIPGLWVCALLGFDMRLSKQPSTLFMSTAFGLSCYGAFSLLFTWLIGLTVIKLIASWVLFQLLAAAIYFRFARTFPKQVLIDIKPSAAILLILGSAFYCALPVTNIYPALYQGGLFVNDTIFDHVKMAIVSSIAREGLPPLNPYYAPLGERIPLMYYYAWHFMAAEIKLLTGSSVWYAEIALTWLTAFATVMFLAALAMRLTHKVRAGWFVILFALTSMLPDLFAMIFGGRGFRWVGYPPSHPLELLWLQLSWAPHHVFAAMCIVLLIFLIVRVLVIPEQRWLIAVLIGLVASVAFGASVWIGGVGLVLVLPFIGFAFWRLRLDYSRMWQPLILALFVCVIFALPVLSSEISGPPADKFPLGIKSYTSTPLFGRGTALKKIGHIVLYWIQFLPLTLGIVYILGLPAAFAYAPKQTEARVFKYLSLAAIIGYLLSVQFVQSVVGSNDFGWRSVNVPIMLLMIWAAVALADLPDKLNHTNWRSNALLVRCHSAVLPLACVGITLGIMSNFYFWKFPRPHHRYSPPGAEQLAWHQDFFQLRQAWNTVLNYTKPNELVQSNPDSYAKVLTRWSAPTGMVLFGDRAMSYAESESVQTFAHSYEKTQKATQYAAVQAIFSANPGSDVLLYARNTLRIKALIVEKRDPVWNSSAIEQSGAYKLVEQQSSFKIYVAH